MTIIEQDFFSKVPKVLGEIATQLKNINSRLDTSPGITPEKEPENEPVKKDTTPGEMLDKVLASLKKIDAGTDFTISTTLKGSNLLLVKCSLLHDGMIITDKTLDWDIMKMEDEINQEIKNLPF